MVGFLGGKSRESEKLGSRSWESETVPTDSKALVDMLSECVDIWVFGIIYSSITDI